MLSPVVSNKMRRISYFAAITIVMMHAGAYFESANYLEAWDFKETLEHNLMGFMHYIGGISMSWFFFSTGFFFFLGYKAKDYSNKIRKRAKSLLVPYFLWNFIMWLYNFLVYLRVGKVDVTLLSFFKSFVFFYWPGVKMWASINLPLWYIIRIFSYFIIAPILYRILINRKIFVMSEIILIGAIFLFKINYYSFFYWLPMFLLGGYMSINKIQQFNDFFSQCHTYSPLRNFFVLCIYLVGGGIAFAENSSISISIVRYVGIIWIMMLLYFYQPKKSEWYEKQSFFIYCAHFIVINFWVRLFSQFFLLQNSIFQYIGLVVITIVSIQIAANFLLRFIPKLYVVLSGGR